MISGIDMTQFKVSIITSLIASFIFWIVFNQLHRAYKYCRIRPRVEVDIKDILLYLLFFIQIPFLQSIHASSLFQSDITEERVTEEGFELALYSKCLSADRCRNEFAKSLLPVGEKLKEHAQDIDIRLDRIQRYNEYLTTKEVLLLKEIGDKIHIYSFDENNTVIDGVEFAAVNPTISYMKNNFYDLYKLYHALQRKTDSYIFLRRNEYERFFIAQKELNAKHYLRYFIRRLVIKGKLAALLDTIWYDSMENRRKEKNALSRYLNLEHEKLFRLSGYLCFANEKDDFADLCVTIRGEDEVQEWKERVEAEKGRKERFNRMCAENRKRVLEREQSIPKITDLDESTLVTISKLFDGYFDA